jgi:uncharacterized protein (DUF58 family)
VSNPRAATPREAAGGLGVAALGVALCVLAGAFGVVALYVPGFALLALALAAELSVRLAARRVGVEREPRFASVEEGAPVHFTLRVSARWLGPGRSEVSAWPGAAFVPMRAQAGVVSAFTLRPPRRGMHAVGSSSLRFADPFSICARLVRCPASEVLVLPRVEPIDASDLARVAGGAREAHRGAGSTPGGEVDSLRPYRPGAPASRIHWPTVARTGTLHERRLDTVGERRPLVVLDGRWATSEETLDMAVRAAASLCVALARLGGCALLLPGETRARRLAADLSEWPALHARLALVRCGEAPLWPAATSAAVVLWVSANTRAAGAARTGAGGGSPGGGKAHYRVSPHPLGGRATLFAVAGCAVQPLAYRSPALGPARAA